MPRPRFTKLDPEARYRLLESAAEEFAVRGYEAASLNRVLDAAGMSKGALYYYFDDKADLFQTVVLHAWEVMRPREPLDLATLDHESYWPVLREKYFELCEAAHERPWLAGIARLIYNPPQAAHIDEVVAGQFAQMRGILREVVLRGQALGVVRSDLPEGLLLNMLLSAALAADRWAVDHWEEVRQEGLEQLADEVFSLLKRLVSPTPGDAGS